MNSKVNRTPRRLGFASSGVFWLLLLAGAAAVGLAGLPHRTSPAASAHNAGGTARFKTPPEHRLKPIETVKAGDRVWSYDIAAGDWVTRDVVRPLVHEYAGDFVTITIADSRVEATGNHPFWVAAGQDLTNRPEARDVPPEQREAARQLSGRWVEARSLRVGDLCVLGSGRVEAVQSLATRSGRQPVYNIEVADLHTYAVGLDGVAVHNKAAGNPYMPPIRMASQASRGSTGLNILNESFTPNPQKVLQNLVNESVAELAANPGLAKPLMSSGSYRELVNGTRVAGANYGKAVERMVAAKIRADAQLSSILRPVSKPFVSTPDFFGYTGQNLHLLDITTVKSIPIHRARPYGPFTEFATHPGLPAGTVFPP